MFAYDAFENGFRQRGLVRMTTTETTLEDGAEWNDKLVEWFENGVTGRLIGSAEGFVQLQRRIASG
jgi:hypothetical protein